MLIVDNLSDLVVNHSCGFFRIRPLGCHISADEHRLRIVAVRNHTQLVAHAELCYHRTGKFGHLLDVAHCTRRHVFDYEFFRNPSAEPHTDIVKHKVFGIVSTVFFGTGHCKSACISAGNYSDFVNGVAVCAEFCKYAVSRLVECGEAFFGFGNYFTLLCRTHRNLVYTFKQFRVGNEFLICTGGENCRFVHKVFKIRSRKTCRKSCNRFEVYFGRQRFVTRVHL